MYEISVERGFAGAHALRNCGTKCERLHGHNWKVKVYVRSASLSSGVGYVMDFTELKSMLDKVLGVLDHRNLNSVAPFNKVNPSAENIAFYIYGRLQRLLERKKVSLHKVTVQESPGSEATYSGSG